jgi:DNA polymerase I-like protein with 3'-5' exonuclease and polymerase domains
MKQDKLIDIQQRVALILMAMEKGFRVDVNTLTDLKRSHESALSSLKNEIQEKLGRAIRLDSNEELGDLLFCEFSLPSLRNTPTGKPCVSLDVLERLCDSYSDVYPFLKRLIEFKKVQSLNKSVKTIFKKLDLHGRIHPEFNHFTSPT